MDANVVKINETTWRIEDTFVRFFLLCGTERAMLIDSGATHPNARKICEELTNLPIFLVNTHGDGDHTAGNGAFSEFYLGEADAVNCKMAEKFPQAKICPLSDGEVFDLGEREIEIITIPGHTGGSVALLDRRNRVLFSGDSVQDQHIFMFGGHRTPEKFGQSLEKLLKRKNDYDKILPSHGAPEHTAELTELVLKEWQKVLQGELEGIEDEMHGYPILRYDGTACGFYCERK